MNMEYRNLSVPRERTDARNRHRRDVIGSKMKAERLKSALQKLRDGERHSKLRNESLLKDFDKVTKMGSDLDIKAEKLKKVKRDYETYINSIYPEWKENLEVSRSPSMQTPDEQRFEAVSKDRQFSRSSELMDDRRSNFHSTLKPDQHQKRKDYSTNRSPVDDTRDSRRPQSSSRDSINYPYDPNYRIYSSRFENGSWHDSDRIPLQHEHERPGPEMHSRHRERSPTERNPVWRDRRRIDAPSSMPSYRGHQSAEYDFISRNHPDYKPHHSPRNTFVDSYNPYYDTQQRRNEIRPQSLNISSLDKSADISDFTILPQALAMSPDGRLVLLPMAVSPGRQVTGEETFRQAAPIKSDVRDRSSRRSVEDLNGQLKNELDRERNDYPSELKQNGVHLPSERPSGLNRNGLSLDHDNDVVDGPVYTRSRREMLDRSADGRPQRSAVASSDQELKRPLKEQQQARRYSEEEIVLSRERVSLSMRDRLQLHGLDALRIEPHTETERTIELKSSGNDFHSIGDVAAVRTEELKQAGQLSRSDRSGSGSKLEQRDGIIKGNEIDNFDISGSVAEQNPSNMSLHDSVASRSQDLNSASKVSPETVTVDKKSVRTDDIFGTERTDSGKVTDRTGCEVMESEGPKEGISPQGDLSQRRPSKPSVDSFEITESLYERNISQPPKSEHNPLPEPVSAPITQSQPEEISNNFVVASRSSLDMNESQASSDFQRAEEHIENEREKGDVNKVSEQHLDPVPDLQIPANQQREVTNQQSEITKQQSDVKTPSKKQTFLEMPALSYLFEEIENRMGAIDRKEFYRAPVDCIPEDVLEKIKRISTVEGNMEKFETRDLCIVSKLEIPGYVMLHGNGSIVAEGKDVRSVYSLDDFRNIISPAFEELWEYIFNHLELLVGNSIFESATAAEIFSHLLCPGNSDEAYEVSQALLRVIDGGEEYYDDEQDGYEMDSQINDDAISERNDQDGARMNNADLEPQSTPASPSNDSNHSSIDQSDKVTAQERATVKHQESKQPKPQDGTPTKQKSNSKTKDTDDLSLDLGSVSEDDDSSTFDSTKLTPHREKTNVSNDTLDIENQDNSQSLDDDITDPDLEDNDNELSNDDIAPKKLEAKGSPLKKPEAKGDPQKEQIDKVYDSDDDLDDLLNSSLVLSGRSTKNDKVEEESSGYQPSTGKQADRRNRPMFNSKQDSFEIDDIKPTKKKSVGTPKNDTFSPDNSRSIASKFRKPGFWENSDSESEAENLNISGGNNLSSKQDDDEFDFEFYN